MGVRRRLIAAALNDHLAPNKAAEGKETAFGLLTPGQLANFVSKRVKEEE
jgi:hypothetical protein